MKDKNLTTGNIKKTLIVFALPYLLSCFMQTFYGMVDLYVVGLFNTKATSSAVAIGSQVTHMLTVIIVGIVMGTTVKIGRHIGEKNEVAVRKTIGSSIILFSIIGIILMLILLLLLEDITLLMKTPLKALEQTREYLRICFAGIPFIVAYNVISGIFRGLGDTKHPMYFVTIACVTNILMDFVLIGGFELGAKGAAIGTVTGQAISVIISLIFIRKRKLVIGLSKSDIKLEGAMVKDILRVGMPIAFQDGFIQIAFIVITVIANSMGLVESTSVGIVEKIIGFLFLVPSSFLAAISSISSQNIGAGKIDRAISTLKYALYITCIWGLVCFIYCNVSPQSLVGLFTKDKDVIKTGCEYLRSYSADVFFAAIHFCFSGFFCGCQKAHLSFMHNIISIIVARVPGAYMASILRPENLIWMGMAAPLGSIISAFICYFLYIDISKQNRNYEYTIK